MLEQDISELCHRLLESQTPASIRLWEILRTPRFAAYKFRRYHPIIYQNPDGIGKFFIPDFYCADKKLVIEIEAGVRSFQKEYDNNPQLVLTQLGLTTIRISNEDLQHNFDEVVEKIFAALQFS